MLFSKNVQSRRCVQNVINYWDNFAIKVVPPSQFLKKKNCSIMFFSTIWIPTMFQLPCSNPFFIFLSCKYIHSKLVSPKSAVRVLCSGYNPQRSCAVGAYVRPSVRIRDRPHNCAPARRPVTDSMLQSSPSKPPPKKIIWFKVKKKKLTGNDPPLHTHTHLLHPNTDPLFKVRDCFRVKSEDHHQI